MKSFVAILLGLGSAVLIQVACVAVQDVGSSDNQGSTGTLAGGPQSGSGGGDAGIDAEFGTGGGTEDTLGYGSLCGDGCVPETGVDGTCFTPDDGPGDGGGLQGGGGAGGATTSGGSGGAGSGAGGASGSGGGADADQGECVLLADERGMHGVCAEPGISIEGGPCLSTGDCAPGLGCVVPGVCRPYCCGSLEACPDSTYCEPAPITSTDVPDGVSSAPLIPVCVPATMCELLDDTSCPPDKTCTIVRADGTTSCVTPGQGELGDPCGTPTGCAPGYVCATSVNECFKLCHLDTPSDCPADHTCQGGSNSYPPNFGVCVEN